MKPGCKNVSIAVSSDGSRVYMLDITRNHLVRMDARPADEVAAEIEAAKNAPPVGSTQGWTPRSPRLRTSIEYAAHQLARSTSTGAGQSAC